MAMKHEQWKEILSAIDYEADLSKDNVIEKVKKKLEVIDSSAYEEWKKTDFDVNHLFQVGNIQYALLHLVAYSNPGNVAGALLKIEGINVNVKKENGCTPLHLAAYYNHKEIVDALLAKGADVNAVDKDGNTPLHLVSSDEGIVKALIGNGADVKVVNKNGSTPLYLVAARYRNEKTVKTLMKKGLMLMQKRRMVVLLYIWLLKMVVEKQQIF